MNPRTRTLIGLAAGATLLFPVTASAHERSSVKSVNAHVKAADQALDRVAELVGDNDQAAAAVAFARNRVEMRRAQAEAVRVKGRDTAAGARALRAVAAQNDVNAETFAGLIEDASGAAQLAVAKGASASVKGRDTALAQLTSLSGRLPAAARPGIARAITAVTGDGQQDIETLKRALESPDVPAEVKPWIEFAIAQITAGLGTATSQLESLLPQLPAAAQGPVQSALDRVNGILGMVTGILQGIFGGGAAGAPALDGLPIPSGLPIPGGIRIPAGPFAQGG